MKPLSNPHQSTPHQSINHPPPKVEGITIDEASLAELGGIGERTSLRHAVQLLTPAALVAQTNGRETITKWVWGFLGGGGWDGWAGGSGQGGAVDKVTPGCGRGGCR